MSLSDDITDFVTNVIGRPCKASEAIPDIIALATRVHAWPTATHAQWTQAIDDAVRCGKLTRISETLWIPIAVAEKKETQLGLFD